MNTTVNGIAISTTFLPSRYNRVAMATIPATWRARIEEPIPSAPWGTAARDGWAYADGDTREEAVAILLEGLREVGVKV